MPCSCFGKKDKKGGPLKNEEDRYHPPDTGKQIKPVTPGSGIPVSAVDVKKQQQQLGSAPQAPVTPPSTPPGGDGRPRSEDDADKATRRRDVVASFYSDQCELIGFKTTGSRPPSAHVGSGQHDRPAATSSPATSSPSSTRSAGACCRADLAEKRREFFKELAVDDFSRGNRPISRLTDPGSQQTPRNSHYQEQLHHTLPHQNKTSHKINIVANHPLVIAQGIHRNSTPAVSSTSQEKQPLLLNSSSSSEEAPKVLPMNADLSVPNILNQHDHEFVSDYDIKEEISDKTPLLLDSDEGEQARVETSVTVQQFLPEITHTTEDHHSLENAHFALESRSQELLIDVSPIEKPVNTVEVISSESSAVCTTELSNDAINKPEEICDILATENSNFIDTSNLKTHGHFVDTNTLSNPQLILESSCNGKQEMSVHVSVPDSEMFRNDKEILNNSNLVYSSPNVAEPSALVESLSGEYHSSAGLHDDQQSDKKFCHETESPPSEYGLSLEDGPQTIVETTRQFISASSEIPHPQKNSQTIVETTRQFITGPPEEQTTKTLVETTQQFLSENSDEPKSSQTIVETTSHFISGIPYDEDSQLVLGEAAQQFLSQKSGEQTIVKETEYNIFGSPDEQITHTIVQTSQQIIPDEQLTQTILDSSQKLFPSSSDNFFLTSVEEPNDMPEEFLLPTGTTIVTTTSTVTDKLLSQPRTHLTDLLEEDEPQLPDVPCFGAPPPPLSPPSPILEVQFEEGVFASPATVELPTVEGEGKPSVLSVVEASHLSDQSAPPFLEEQGQSSEFSSASLTPHLPQLEVKSEENEPPSTLLMPGFDDVQQLQHSAPSPPPTFDNEDLPSTLQTGDILVPNPSLPKEETSFSTTVCTTTTTTTTTISSTCGVETVSSSPLVDDGLGSEIDDALESIEGLSEEGNIGRAAASS